MTRVRLATVVAVSLSGAVTAIYVALIVSQGATGQTNAPTIVTSLLVGGVVSGAASLLPWPGRVKLMLLALPVGIFFVLGVVGWLSVGLIFILAAAITLGAAILLQRQVRGSVRHSALLIWATSLIAAAATAIVAGFTLF